MKLENPFARAALALAVILFVTAVNPKAALADQGFRTIVGSWMVTITPDDGSPAFSNQATLNWPGTVITGDPNIGTGHGAWKRTGPRDFRLRFIVLIRTDNTLGLPPGSRVEVTADLTVNRHGDVATGTNTGVFTDADGNVIFAVSGGARFDRISVD